MNHSNPPITFQIFTLGCKVNQYESEQVRHSLTDWGFICQEEKAAPVDWIFVNTCAVTQESEAKSRKMIRQLIRRLTPKKVLIWGCAAKNDPHQFTNIPGVTYVVTGEKNGGNRVADLLETVWKDLKNEQNPNSPEESERPEKESGPDLTALECGLERFGERHRAYVKVQDGCRQFCTYCLIPHLRNELSSVPAEEVQAEVRSLLRHGYREIIITGIHLGYYGLNPRSRSQLIWTLEDRKKTRQTNLTDLMERLAKLRLNDIFDPATEPTEPSEPSELDFRLRISSLEAHEAGDELLHIMAENRTRICPHLHLSMQSGSPTVHHRMNRPGTVDQYIERCEAARRILDHPALTTDVIVGFPGETEKEFLETCDVVRQIGFSKIHIFPFSARPGTPAAQMKDFVPSEEKHRRELFLAEIERELHAQFVESLQGRQTQFLIERFHPETKTVTGTSEYYLQSEFPGTVEDVGHFLMR